MLDGSTVAEGLGYPVELDDGIRGCHSRGL